MIYSDGQAWRDAPRKKVLLFGMSGLGKTHLSHLLRGGGEWFHYSIDYRIGTRYMGELIADNAKREAMKVPFLRELLLSDSIYIGSNITFDNLTPVSTYLGKPGDPERGGLPFGEYTKRQDQFARAEIASLRDTPFFIDRAQALYEYANFICDTGGSICEWVDPDDPEDPILSELSRAALMVWIEGSDGHTAELVRRFDAAPKPMAYQPAFLMRIWQEYLAQEGIDGDDVDPDAFIRWAYSQALDHRRPRYRSMAENWGVTLQAAEVGRVFTVEDFIDLVADALDGRMRG